MTYEPFYNKEIQNIDCSEKYRKPAPCYENYRINHHQNEWKIIELCTGIIGGVANCYL